MDDKQIGRVLVVGAGVAGIRAALDLAETGYEVLLSESSPAVGGILSKLDYQFPTDHCGMCRMLPFLGRENASQFCMRKSLYHDRITILPDTDVTACSGEPGRMEVTLRHRARWVDTDICIGEGDCADVCPVSVSDQFNEGLTPRKAIYRPVPHNLPNLWTIDRDACTRCGDCVPVCPVNAIALDASDQEETVTVGAVILATGAGLFDPSTEPNFYSYGKCPHVLTSLEFERLLSSSGTYTDTLRRPHDGREAKRVAWIHCVGSRDRRRGRGHCSSVCCMFALKEAVLARERGGSDTEVTLFYMDLRTYGKDYYRYREAAEQEHGVRLVRCRPQSVEVGADGDPVIRYFASDGTAHEEPFDLVVLATGQVPPAEVDALREAFGFEVDEQGFARIDPGAGLATTAPGVFACGSFTGLKDISDALVQGSSAAAEASVWMREKGLLWQKPDPLPPERAVAREDPLVALVLCRWPPAEGGAILDLDLLAEEMRSQRGVHEVRVVEGVCREGKDEVAAMLAGSAANRVLFAACLPFVYKRGLRDIAEQAGFNPHLVDVVDLRGEVRRTLRSGNGHTPEAVASSLLDSAVASLCAKDPVEVTRIPVERRALVVGGGAAGMHAARTLADQGVEVVLLERSRELGGHARRLRTTLQGQDPGEVIGALEETVRSHEGITCLTGAEVIESRGSVGRFVTTIRIPGDGNGGSVDRKIVHGATVIATGGREAPADGAFGHGESEAILTQEELETALADGSIGADGLGTVVMIQCVGSREPGGREYCSRICCSAALKNARKILEVNPDARILILYRDLMAYGSREEAFSEARARGVIFSTYDMARKPTVTLDDGRPEVRYIDEVLGEEISVHPDRVVLATGIVPTDQKDLAAKMGLDLNEDGFFQEADYKFRPVEMVKEGVAVCGLAHSPRALPEAMTMAEAAAQRILTVLSQTELISARLVSRIHAAACAVCQVCVDICPYQARHLDEANDRIVVDPLSCQGCGICVAACPSSAAHLAGRADRQILVTLDAQLGDVAAR